MSMSSECTPTEPEFTPTEVDPTEPATSGRPDRACARAACARADAPTEPACAPTEPACAPTEADSDSDASMLSMHGAATPISLDGSPLSDEAGEAADEVIDVIEIEDSIGPQSPAREVNLPIVESTKYPPTGTSPYLFVRAWPIRMSDVLNSCSSEPAIIWNLCCPFKVPYSHCEKMLDFLESPHQRRKVCKYMWGKTWCPKHRWDEASYNYKRSRYDNMFLLHCAADCWDIGDLEADLIDKYSPQPNCMNKLGGKYKGIDVGMAPHFLYLVVGYCR
jgi:hypothetical protein